MASYEIMYEELQSIRRLQSQQGDRELASDYMRAEIILDSHQTELFAPDK